MPLGSSSPAHTPESLLPRSDSRNPATTCKGLTSAGRPCRRAIARSQVYSRSMLVRGDDNEGYCWQHVEQSAKSNGSPRPIGNQSATIRERTSVDTLVERLGLLDVRDRIDSERKMRQDGIAGRRHTDGPTGRASKSGQAVQTGDGHQKRKNQGKLRLYCCIGLADDEVLAARPVRLLDAKPVSRPQAKRHPAYPQMQEIPGRVHARPIASSQQAPPSLPEPDTTKRRPIPRRSHTGELLSLIPKTTSPQTTALLLAELAKPISTADEEGYIYIFWLTPESLPATPPVEIAPSLLSPQGQGNGKERRASAVMRDYASTNKAKNSNTSNVPNTIMLKIGRASNVHRRLNEWSRQCGYNLSLIRYYPYSNAHSSSPSSSPASSGKTKTARTSSPTPPRKVPHAHKVERLIHIELADKKARDAGRCERCGTAHREWFDVEASREGVRGVDEVVRRWVEWSLGLA